jgi:hypothetical protein
MFDKGHIDLATMERYVLGTLVGTDLDLVRRHLETCPRCSLELKRFERFETIESDEDLALKGEWLYARMKLDRAFRERIARAAAGREARGPRRSRGGRAAAWLIPAAAVAVILFLLARHTANERAGAPAGEKAATRVAPPIEYEIELVGPVGEIEGSPRSFSWRSERGDTAFVIEVLTPSLERIYRTGDIGGPAWSATDTLAALLRPNIVYLWSVRGYRGLEPVTVSPVGWFRIRP